MELASTKPAIDWSSYAQQYDLMCDNNTYYQDNIRNLCDFIASYELPAFPKILDLGAGTGNFVTALRHALPDSDITHLDANREMNKIAMQKYHRLPGPTIRVLENEVHDSTFEEGEFDLILCINALYAMTPQEIVLSKVRQWLKPEGVFYVLDLGREMDTVDWGLHFLVQAAKERELLGYLRNSLIKGREVVKQNRMTRLAQKSGNYWTHDTPHFEKLLSAAGFKISSLKTCYRGYSDLAICHPIHT